MCWLQARRKVLVPLVGKALLLWHDSKITSLGNPVFSWQTLLLTCKSSADHPNRPWNHCSHYSAAYWSEAACFVWFGDVVVPAFSRAGMCSPLGKTIPSRLLPRVGKRPCMTVGASEQGWAAGWAEERGCLELLQSGRQPGGAWSPEHWVIHHARAWSCKSQRVWGGDSSPKSHPHPLCPWGMSAKQEGSWMRDHGCNWWPEGKKPMCSSITYSQVGIFCSPFAYSVWLPGCAAVPPFRNL